MPCGGFIIAVSCCLLGAWGARSGPRMPTRTKIATMAPPVKAFTWSRGSSRASRPAFLSVADSRVNDCIKTVNDQIDGDERHGVGHHDARDQRIVARVERGDEQAAASPPGENRLDDDRAAEQRAELESDHGDNGNQRVAGD